MKSSGANLPLIAEDGLRQYLQEIRKFPLLTAEEEYMLARRWKDHADPEAAHRLVTSHLRLVARIAMGYRGYGLPVGDLISEGNVGMMQAVKRFDPERGFRLATYAMWWIRASIQEYILHSWSLVKIGTTAAQKKLFFSLRKTKAQMRILDDQGLTPEQVSEIARRLELEERDVIEMNARMAGGDYRLDAKVRSDDDSGAEWIDWLPDQRPDQETVLGEAQLLAQRRQLLEDAMSVLSGREREIFIARRLSDEPQTLEQLSQTFGISRERVRQIEARAFGKIAKAVKWNSRALPAPAAPPA